MIGQFKEEKLKRGGIVKSILIIVTFTIFCCGCGSEEKEISVKDESVQVVEEVQGNNLEEVAEKDADNDERQTNLEEEMENQQEDKQGSDMKEAKVIATVGNYLEFLDYVETFDKPVLLIYNEKEGYVINMGEGEYYQLKSDDRIFEYDTAQAVAMSDTLEAGEGISPRAYIFEMFPDYTKFEKPHKVLYVVYYTKESAYGNLENEEDYFLLTCYLDPPVD